ncbi:MAG: phosphocarrier protein HPr [Gammaproteobacteria bacterium]|nr:phosphocarrier protein HPr [Gammaproteobacteria bacterium]
MRQAHLTLINPLGLHARAAAKLVDVAKSFGSDISLEINAKKADGKSIMDLLMLGAPVGAEVTLSVAGTDEDQACDAISALILAGFHEIDV